MRGWMLHQCTPGVSALLSCALCFCFALENQENKQKISVTMDFRLRRIFVKSL